MKTKILTLLSIVGFGLILLFQGCGAAGTSDNAITISGEVSNATTGNPIRDAIVEIMAPSSIRQSTTSDSLGKFSFTVEADSVFDVTIEASKQSFNPKTTSFRVAPGVDVTDLIIQLVSQESTGGDDDSGGVGGEAAGAAALVLSNLTTNTINVSETGGTVNTAFTFLVQDSAGRTVERPTDVQFSIIQGPGGGESITPTVATTNASGLVTSNLFSGDSSGTVRIEALIERPEVGLTIRSTPVLINIISGFAVLENFHIVPEIHNFEAFGFLSSDPAHSNAIIASLGDLKNNPVVAGTAVYFWAEYGGNIGSSTVEVATDHRGLAAVELRADGSTPTGHPNGIGFVDIFAQTVDVNNDYITQKETILFTTRPAVITVNPTTFNIGNGGGESFTYTVTDLNGYPMAAGTNISVEVGSGLTTSGDVNIEMPDVIVPPVIIPHVTPPDNTFVPGVTEFAFSIADAAPPPAIAAPANDVVTIVVTTPSGFRSSLSIPGSRAKTIGN